MSEQIYKDAWSFEPTSFLAQAHGTPVQENDGSLLYARLDASEGNTRLEVPVTAIEYEVFPDWYRSFFGKWHAEDLTQTPLGNMHAFLETHWNQNELFSTRLTTKTNNIFRQHQVAYVLFEDEESNPITHVSAAVMDRYAFDNRGIASDRLDLVSLPFTREGNLVKVDTTSIKDHVSHRVIWGFGVTDRTKPLYLSRISFAKRDTVRELANIDASLPIEYIGS